MNVQSTTVSYLLLCKKESCILVGAIIIIILRIFVIDVHVSKRVTGGQRSYHWTHYVLCHIIFYVWYYKTYETWNHQSACSCRKIKKLKIFKQSKTTCSLIIYAENNRYLTSIQIIIIIYKCRLCIMLFISYFSILRI